MGETLAQARGHRDVVAVEYDPANLAGATLLDPTYRGWAQLVVEPSSRRLRGATFVGPGASELLYAATLAITTAVDLRHLWSVVPPFPTVSEVWLRLLEAARAQL
ncbi:hypothetical protein [Isoptericola jiangsuensis]|uniref:hypothetical protein n=1 Tax=Isoptericola jiangsuensis TaxID=548579 RepID=UPI001FE62563|nr:hypothetical protein [Isoptericola jiangsuensis]